MIVMPPTAPADPYFSSLLGNRHLLFFHNNETSDRDRAGSGSIQDGVWRTGGVVHRCGSESALGGIHPRVAALNESRQSSNSPQGVGLGVLTTGCSARPCNKVDSHFDYPPFFVRVNRLICKIPFRTDFGISAVLLTCLTVAYGLWRVF